MIENLFVEERLLNAAKGMIVEYFEELEKQVSTETGKFSVTYNEEDAFVKCTYGDRFLSFNVELKSQIWVTIQSPNLPGITIKQVGFPAFKQVNGAYYSSDLAYEHMKLNRERLDELMDTTFKVK